MTDITTAASFGPGEATGVPPADVIWLTPNVWTEPFWLAAAEHRLILPRCTECGAHRLPPSPFCPECRAQTVEWEEHSGAGTIYSFTIIRHAVIPDVKDALPFCAAVVALDGLADPDGCRLIGNIVGTPAEAVQIGQSVELIWYDVREGTSVPCFRIVS